MGVPRFEPRALLDDPSEFGRNPYARFVTGAELSVEERRELRTAKLQHQIAFRIRMHLRAEDVTLKEFAARHPYKVRTLRLLRGEGAMQVEDIFWAEEILGERQIIVQFAALGS